MIPLAHPKTNVHRRNVKGLPIDAVIGQDEETATNRIIGDDKKIRPQKIALIPIVKAFALAVVLVLFCASSKQTTVVFDSKPIGISVEIQPNGPKQKIFINIPISTCVSPVARLRLVGPEIYAFSPFFANSSDFVSWSGVYKLDVTFDESVLLPGKYRAQVTLLKCGHERSVGLDSALFATKNASSIFPILDRDVFIPFPEVSPTNDTGGVIDMAWINAPKCEYSHSDGEHVSEGCTNSMQQKQQQIPHNFDDYVFMEVDRISKRPIYDNGAVTLKDGNIIIGKPHSLRNNQNADPTNLLKYFGDLSNYELVCWLGDDDADRYRRAFLELYPLMKAHFQRPFKFHYIRLTDIFDPTKSFSETSHHTYRKCKIFFISYGIDRMEDDREMTPDSYAREVEMLMRHIETSHPDTTFPAWFLTPRSNSSASSTRSPDHVHLFISQIRSLLYTPSQFQTRIQLMDNTDITESFWQRCNDNFDCETMEKRVAATVGMRCMEKIAMQVKTWRSLNQKGKKDGLMRNGNLIPNPEFVKYMWDNSLIHRPGSA
ncbi:hypothetical protein HJC23_012267 [Cyclotella cryptica]|uniref:Uncharacterized protein n=1 Tax=Cyclotella cryptica TaxID=29204 RepID=A0ABD3PMB1_9STRA|eukprot:CCRYP_013198-RA/>CCRYP_013198-RA protein AED:0.36 eAED:0.36 QI:0/-1/0/1/-1/1/1/0/543